MSLATERAAEAGLAAPPGGVAAELARLVAPLLGGTLPFRLRAWDGSEAGTAGAPLVLLRSPNVLRRLVWSPGELGLAQAYVTGELDFDGDLRSALATVWAGVRGASAEHPKRPGKLSLGTSADALKTALRLGAVGRPLPAPASQARLRGRLHTRRRDRSAISHHYDLSNEFYGLVLDSHLAYSCAYWTSDAPDYGLEEAQRDKFDLVCRKLGLQPGQRLLDVGCGWGSLSLHAAAHYGVQVTGVTLSKEQQAFAAQRARTEGLADRVDIRLQDYRDIADGPYDAVVSLEMGEHVGEHNYPTYAAALLRQLRPQGRLVLQQMSRRGAHPGGGAFIESFIAPDMFMRPVGRTVELLERAGFEVRDVHALREHYVRTVAAWYETFEKRYDDVVALVGAEVARVWRLYLVGGALAFEEGRMGVDQNPRGQARVRRTQCDAGDAGVLRGLASGHLMTPQTAAPAVHAASGFATAPFLEGLAITLAAVAAALAVTFAVAIWRGHHSVVDVTWGLGFAVIALTSLLVSSGHGDTTRRVLVATLTTVWGVRLAVHIGRRNWGKGEDPRYAELLARAPGHPNRYALRMVYLTQGIVMWFVSLPVQVAMYEGGGVGVLTWVGTGVWLVGFYFEAVGDWQLTRFKADPASKGQVMDRGLWRYTRHPNYFGDACVWWGLYLIAAQHWQGSLTILSAVAMTYTLANGTGKPTLEKGMADRRPGYAEYVRRTSGFLPLPPRG